MTALRMRPATIDDADRLLTWRNDPVTRQAGYTTDEVQPAEHLAWLTALLANPKRELYVAEEAGPVGTVRVDDVDGVQWLSWTVAPEARGRGIATRMVRLIAGTIADPLHAAIKADNLASARIAERAGLVFALETGGVRYFSRPAQTLAR